ncbi:hypothetical protein D9M68_610350 [compost metagenome]
MAGFATVVAPAAVLSHGVGVDVVHAQARHDLGVEDDLEAAAGARDDDVGHDHVALDIDEAAPGFGFQPGDDGQSGAGGFIVDAAQGTQALDVALGHQLHGLVADGQRRARFGGVAQLLDLQPQAFAEVARAHAGGLHVLQPAQGHAQLGFSGLQLFDPG